jgi:hypothetical protein
VIVYCRIHGNDMGVVEPHPGSGLVQLSCRDPRWRDRFAAMAGIEGRHNSRQILEDRAISEIPVRGCRDCGPREVPIKDLLAAFAAGLPKIRV